MEAGHLYMIIRKDHCLEWYGHRQITQSEHDSWGLVPFNFLGDVLYT